MPVKQKPSPKTFITKIIGPDQTNTLLDRYTMSYDYDAGKLYFQHKKKLAMKAVVLVSEPDLKSVAWGPMVHKLTPTTKLVKQHLIDLLNEDFPAEGQNIAKDPAAHQVSGVTIPKTVTDSMQGHPAECSVMEMKSLDLVPLRQAKRLFQPVKGTSEDARYFFVAQFENGVKLAVKYKKGSSAMAIRIEGDHLSSVKQRWVGAGLQWDDGKAHKYQSAHFKVATPTEAVKTVASVMFALGSGFATPAPVLWKLAEV